MREKLTTRSIFQVRAKKSVLSRPLNGFLLHASYHGVVYKSSSEKSSLSLQRTVQLQFI